MLHLLIACYFFYLFYNWLKKKAIKKRNCKILQELTDTTFMIKWTTDKIKKKKKKKEAMALSSLGNLCELILKMYTQHLPDKQEWGLDNQNRIQMCTKIGFLLMLFCHLYCTYRDEIHKNIGPSDIIFSPKILFSLLVYITICRLSLQWEISLTLSKFFFTLFLLRTCF